MFYRGLKADLAEAVDGTIRFATDTQQLFIDYNDTHIEISDVVQGFTAAQIVLLPSPLNKLYLSSDTHALYYYDSDTTSWINIITNHTHTASQITDLGALATVSFITVENIDATEGLDFGDEDLIAALNAAAAVEEN